MKRPKEIIYIPRKNGIELFSSKNGSFWYRIIIHSGKPMHIYTGSKEGELNPYDNSFTGYYVGSVVKNKKQFEEDIIKYDYTMEVTFHKAKEAIYFEKEYNDLHDVKNSLEYFNEHNGGDRVPNTNMDKKINRLSEDITESQDNSNISWVGGVDGFFEETVNVNPFKTVLWALKKINDCTRSWNYRSEIPGSVKSIAEKIDNTHGVSARNAKPILIFKDFYGEGKPYLKGGGWHLVKACNKSKWVIDDTELRVILIPKKIWIKFVDTKQTDSELKYRHITKICNMDNPEQEHISVPSANYDIATDLINSYYADGRPIKHAANIEYVDNKVAHHKTREAIFKIAQDRIDEASALSNGKELNDWENDPVLKKKLKDKLKERNKKQKENCASYGSSGNSIRNIEYSLSTRMRTHWGNKCVFTSYIFHPSIADEKAWADNQAKIQSNIDFWLDAKNEEALREDKNFIKVTFNFIQAPHLRDKAPVDDPDKDTISEVVLP